MSDEREQPDTTGTAIRIFRVRRGLSQRHLADLAGVSQITVSRWERGVRVPRPEALQRLLDALGRK